MERSSPSQLFLLVDENVVNRCRQPRTRDAIIRVAPRKTPRAIHTLRSTSLKQWRPKRPAPADGRRWFRDALYGRAGSTLMVESLCSAISRHYFCVRVSLVVAVSSVVPRLSFVVPRCPYIRVALACVLKATRLAVSMKNYWQSEFAVFLQRCMALTSAI